MIIQFEKAAGGSYQGLIEDLFSLDRQDKPALHLDQVLPHFTQMQSLIRATIEYCEVAFRETNLGHVYPARALLRSAFDHVILSSYLHKHQNGAKTTQLILDKNYRELAEKAKGANIKQIQYWVGHSSITETLDTYGHLFPDSMDDLADKLDEHATEEATKQEKKSA